MIFIPVYNGKHNNKNGEILNKMLNNSSGTYNIAGFFRMISVTIIYI